MQKMRMDISDIADKIYGIKKDTNVGRDNIRELHMLGK